MAVLQFSRQRPHSRKHFEIRSREVYDASLVLSGSCQRHAAKNRACDRDWDAGRFAGRQARLPALAAAASALAREADGHKESRHAVFAIQRDSVYLTR